MAGSPVDLNQAALDGVKQYVASDEFKKKLIEYYKEQIAATVENAEKKARTWQVILTLLVLGFVFVLVFGELLNVREKRLSIDEEFVTVLKTAQELRKTIDEVHADTVRVKAEVDAKDKTISATLDSLDKRAHDLEGQVNRLSRTEKRNVQP